MAALVAAGADPEASSFYEDTPLDIAELMATAEPAGSPPGRTRANVRAAQRSVALLHAAVRRHRSTRPLGLGRPRTAEPIPPIDMTMRSIKRFRLAILEDDVGLVSSYLEKLPILGDATIDGYPVLVIAATVDARAVAARLLAGGARSDHVSIEAQTALSVVSAHCKQREFVRLLLAHDASLVALGEEDEAPLVNAVSSGCLANTRALIEAGSDVNARSKEGKTALAVAIAAQADTRGAARATHSVRWDPDGVVRLLRSKGTRP